MSTPHVDAKETDDLTPKDKAWWVECIGSFITEGIEEGDLSVELTAQIEAAFDKGQEHIQQLFSKGSSEADQTMNSMLESISERLENIENRLNSRP